MTDLNHKEMFTPHLNCLNNIKLREVLTIAEVNSENAMFTLWV